MKSVLKRVEEITETLNTLKPSVIKLLDTKISAENPSSGSLKIRALLNEKVFVDIYEFLFEGRVIRYSYSLVKNNRSILRYDNAPHHRSISTYPHHKHIKENKIEALENYDIKSFVEELKRYFKEI